MYLYYHSSPQLILSPNQNNCYMPTEMLGTKFSYISNFPYRAAIGVSQIQTIGNMVSTIASVVSVAGNLPHQNCCSRV